MEKTEKYRVIVSKRAAEMLVSHAAFLSEVSEEAANRLILAFEGAANSLEAMPKRCPWLVSEYISRNKYRKLLFEKKYLLLFQICGRHVVEHCARRLYRRSQCEAKPDVFVRL